MRWHETLIVTGRETPKDAALASHILLVRAGYVRLAAAGVYTFLPLGLRVLERVGRIINGALVRGGAVELRGPVTQGGRDALADTARACLKSYRQLPVTVFQLQTRVQAEERARSGLLHAREYTSHEAWSFHADESTLGAAHERWQGAYRSLFVAAGLPVLDIEAEGGLQGSAARAFVVLAEAGEEVVAVSENGDCAAEIEVAAAPDPEPPPGEPLRDLQEVFTPGAGRVEDVCPVLGARPSQMIKTLIYRSAAVSTGANAGAKERRVVALVRGDREVSAAKLRHVAGAELELADLATIEQVTGASVGFAGPHGLLDRARQNSSAGGELLVVVDREVATMRNAGSGANRTDYHVIHINPGRDFPLSGPGVTVADIRRVCEGERSPTGSGSPMRLRRAISLGSMTRLGAHACAQLELTYRNADGQVRPMCAAHYQLELTRVVATIVEQHHDADGIIWPLAVAPFDVLILALDPTDGEVLRVAGELHDQLVAGGAEVLLDDRDERAGVKFKDADLVGIPLRVIVGRRGLATGTVELAARDAHAKEPMSPAEAVHTILGRMSAASGHLAASVR